MSTPEEARPELGVECSCGFKRRATQISDGDRRWNGREIEGFHYYQIGAEAKRFEGLPEAPSTHSMSMGLIATLDWSPVTDTEQKIGEAYWFGYWEGQGHLRLRMKERLAKVTTEEFG